MAEQLRSVRDILEELFKGRDAAIEKYAKVRHTQYELNLWRSYGLPLREVPKGVKFYFSQRFLNGKKIEDASPEELAEAFKRLGYAVSNGCKGRCESLTAELNLKLEELGLQTIQEPERFLDWLTFSYTVRRDFDGSPVTEKPYGFEIRVFDDQRNRKEFWGEIRLLLRVYHRILSMQDVLKLVLVKRKVSLAIRD